MIDHASRAHMLELAADGACHVIVEGCGGQTIAADWVTG